MLLELGYFDYTQNVQRQASIAGYAVNGLLVFVSREDIEPDTHLTVRSPSATHVERIDLDKLHQISDWWGGAGDDDTANLPGFIYVDLGLIALADGEELTITLDCLGTPGAATKIGVAAVVDDLPQHDELQYAYAMHSDGSFNVEAATSLFVFGTSLSTSGELINVKLGDDTRSTTLRATNWYANLLGKIELDNTTMGVAFDYSYGQPMTVNHSTAALVSVVRRVVQMSPERAKAATARLAKLAARKIDKVDASTIRATT